MIKQKIYVTNLKDNNIRGSLRYAINFANSCSYTEILFKVCGIINLNSPLPNITSQVEINANTKNNVPVIEINCSQKNGLTLALNSSKSIINGLSITNSKDNGLNIFSNDNKIYNCYFGIDLNGNMKSNEGNGIYLKWANDNIIGINEKNISGYASNVISGNLKNGICLDNSFRNKIQSNFIGTNKTGTNAIPNKINGLFLYNNSNNNKIGGRVYTNSEGITNNPTGSKGEETPVSIFPPLGNLISGNEGNGIYINSNKNSLNGNFIGVDVSGNIKLGNKKNGVYLFKSEQNILQGCRKNDEPFIYYNICSGNGENGILVTDGIHNVIQGNFFGIAANNNKIISNNLNGILVNGYSKGTTVGGVIPLGNVCAGNKENGIKVCDYASSFITFNTFGGLFAFGGAAPNGKNGLLITSKGGDQTVRTNVFSGNNGNGIELSGCANDVTIESAIVGLDTGGSSRLPNKGNGLLIGGCAKNNTIGVKVASVIPRNSFSANGKNGICITDRASNNTINLSFIGLTVSGEDDNCSNCENGILVDKCAYNNFIGPNNIDQDIFTNYISTNKKYGICLTGSCFLNNIESNVIGYTLNGDSAKNIEGSIKNNSSKANTNIIKNNKT